jgi:hypothetical protein
MGIARSTYYAEPTAKAADAEIIDEMKAICDEFEAYSSTTRRLNSMLCVRCLAMVFILQKPGLLVNSL